MNCRAIIKVLIVISSVVLSFSYAYADQKKFDKINADLESRKKAPLFRAGELIVKYKKKGTETEQQAVSSRLNNKHGSIIRREFKKLRMQHVKLKKSMTVEQGLVLYKDDPDVEYVQPNYNYRLNATPNDARYNELWNMARIKAPQAWDLSAGSGSFVVGTIDTGIDYNHPDLKANIWVNSVEQSGTSLADDDVNGYIDDIFGWNTLTNSGDPLDDESHGTHVAGTIGAAGNNGIGVAGINWNVKTQLSQLLILL